MRLSKSGSCRRLKDTEESTDTYTYLYIYVLTKFSFRRHTFHFHIAISGVTHLTSYRREYPNLNNNETFSRSKLSNFFIL